jgi:hypothetical protein
MQEGLGGSTNRPTPQHHLVLYAKTIRATTGTVKTSVLATHHTEFTSPRMRILSAMIAMASAERPLMRDTVSASNPRVRHTNTSTGVSAIAKTSLPYRHYGEFP